MGGEMKPLERLGRAVAKAEDDRIAPAVERARERLFSEARPLARRPRRMYVAWVAAAAIAATVLVFFVARRRDVDPLTFEVKSSPGVVREWVYAPPAQEVPLRFSDGTTVLFAPDTRGTVSEIARQGARVKLERGHAVVSVAARTGARWMFDVGPFAVAVAGTRFDASWQPSGEIFELTIHDGSVRVSGPTIAGERTLVAGQHLRIALAIKESALDDVPAPTAATAQESGDPVPSSSPSGGPARRAAREPSWRELANDGRYGDALAAVGQGFDAICTSGSAGDVLALADTARLAGDAARGKKAYGHVRSRFAGSSQAAVAAFSLGRMAAQENADSAAAVWFETYLREAPDDRLAREALGRAMEARDRHGDVAAARGHADRYLQRYPEGPHAKLARKIKSE